MAVVAVFRFRVAFGFAFVAAAGAASLATSAFFRVRRGLGTGKASATADASSSPATLGRGVRRRRVGVARFGSSSGALRLGGGGSIAGGVGARRAIARDGSGGAVEPVGCAAPSDETSKM